MAIVLTMAASGLIGLDVAAAMIMGSNIGTTIDAYLASIGATVNAKRAARVHLLFNILGLIFLNAYRHFVLETEQLHLQETSKDNVHPLSL